MGELPIARSLTVDASSLPNGLTIDASSNDPTPGEAKGDGSRIFAIDDGDRNHASDVLLRGLTQTGGDLTGEGGAIRTVERLTAVDGAVVHNSTVGSDIRPAFGGGIWASDILVIDSSRIVDNSAIGSQSGSGGGLFSWSSVTIRSSTIAGNRADFGGGIFLADALGGSSTLKRLVISENRASRSRGGVAALPGVTMADSVISENRAGSEGGGILARDDVALTETVVSANSSQDNGGGIRGYANVVVASSSITDNVSGASGGGIYAARTATLTRSRVLRNTAQVRGRGASTLYLDLAASTIGHTESVARTCLQQGPHKPRLTSNAKRAAPSASRMAEAGPPGAVCAGELRGRRFLPFARAYSTRRVLRNSISLPG